MSTSNPLLYAGMKPEIPSEKISASCRGERMHSCLCISDSEFNSKLSTPAISYIIDLPLAIKKVIDVSTTGMSNVIQDKDVMVIEHLVQL